MDSKVVDMVEALYPSRSSLELFYYLAIGADLIKWEDINFETLEVNARSVGTSQLRRRASLGGLYNEDISKCQGLPPRARRGDRA